MKPVRTRYAPSPTGHLHIGGARTALFSYLLARKTNGKFVVRIEDTDRARHVETGVSSQLDGLKWLGIDWDESVDKGGPHAPYSQLERLDLYKPYVDQLLEGKNAYFCYCNEEELEQERERQEKLGEMPKYSGKCRTLTEAEQDAYKEEGREPCIRFAVPANQKIAFTDLIRGEVQFSPDETGDFVIVRPNGIPTYNFAVVLDDHLMEISHVLRGEEHLSNTPRQLLLYEALGWEPPQFGHIPLILNADRKKMSKRDESIVQFIQQYEELGYLPEAIVNFMALLGWSPGGEEEIFSHQQLIDQFTVERVAKSPAVFDTEKLNWMNNHYIKEAPVERVAALAIPHLQAAGKLPQQLDEQTKEWAIRLVALYQEQLRYAAEIVSLSEMFFVDQPNDEEDAFPVLAEETVPNVLSTFLRLLQECEEFTVGEVKSILKQVQKETGCKGRALFMPVRAALTGQIQGRDLNETIVLLGKERVTKRLEERLSK